MQKLSLKLISLTVLIAILLTTVPATAGTVGGTYDASGYLIRDLFSGGTKRWNYQNNSNGSYISIEQNATDKFSLYGTPSLQFRCAYKTGISIYEYLPSMLSMPSIEPENMALSFEIQLRRNTDKAYIGLTCYGNTMISSSSVTPAAGVVRINLKEYANLTVNTWTKVVIPFKYFMSHGEFICRESGEGALTEFDYLRTNGVYIAAEDAFSGVSANQNLVLSLYDKLMFIEYINEPGRVTVNQNGKGADVSWSESEGYDTVEGYYLFRRKGTGNAQLIETLSPNVRHYTDTVASAGNYTYIVQAFNSTNGFVSLPSQSDNIYLSTTGNEPQTEEATPQISSITLYDRKNNALAEGSTSTYVNGVEATVTYGGSGFFDGVLKTEVFRDGTLTDSDERSISEPAGITVSYNDKHQYTTLLPGSYTFRTGVYKNGIPVSNTVEKSFTVSAPVSTYSVTVENTPRQIMDGWGLCPFTVNTDYCDWKELEDIVMKDLGINITRYFVYPESFDANGNATEDFYKNVKNIDYCHKNGIDTYILTWLGPERDDEWTEQNVANYYEQSGWAQFNRRLKRSKEETYINAIINHLKIIRDNDLPLPYSVCIQNEPMGAKIGFVRPAQYERLVKLLDRKLKENGMEDVNIMAFEPVSYQTMYGIAGDSGVRAGTSYLFDFSEFNNDPAFRDAVDIVGVHTYDPPSDSETSRLFAYTYETQVNSYGKKKWMTEFSLCGAAKNAYLDPSLGQDYDIEALFREIRGLLGDVIWAGNSAWLHHLSYYANDMLTKDGYCYEVTDSPDKPFTNGMVYGVQRSRILTTGNVYAALQAIFTNAPSGSVTKRATTNWSSLTNDYAVLADLGAFENGGSTVVVLVNQSTDDAYITLNNLKGTSADVNTLTSGAFECKLISTLAVSEGTAQGVFIPAKSVNIIVSK